MKRKLGEILLSSGAVTQADIDLAIDDQTAGEPGRLGDLLVALGRLTPQQLAEALSKQHGVPTISLPSVDPEVLATVPMEFQKTHRLVPFRAAGGDLFVAMADPGDTDAIEELRYGSTQKVTVFVAASDEIDAIHALADAPPPSDEVVPQPALDDLFSDLASDAEPAPPPLIPPVAPVKSRATLKHAAFVPPPPPDELGDVPSLGEAPPPPHSSAPSSPFELSPAPSAPPQKGGVHAALSTADADVEISTSDLNDIPPPRESVPDWLTTDPDDVPPSQRAKDAAERALETVLDEPPLPAPSSPSSLDADSLFADAVVDQPTGDVSAILETGLEELSPEPESQENPVPFETEQESPPPPSLWTGRLDDIPPSRLITAAVKVLVERGLITEADVLSVLGKK